MVKWSLSITTGMRMNNSPLIKAAVDMMFAFGNSTIEFGINFSVTCINPTIPNHLCDPRIVVKYIGRYLGRPVIATSRIDKYDGEMVTCKTIIKPGVKFLDLFILKNIRVITLFTE